MNGKAWLARWSTRSTTSAEARSAGVQVAVYAALAVAVLALCVFAWISYDQAYMADDYPTLMRAQDSEPLEYTLRLYRDWTGRMVPVFLAWAVVPHRAVFAVINTAVFLGTVLLAFRLGARRWPRRTSTDMIAALLVFAALWFGAPAADETLLWRVGAINYSWTLFAALALLVPFRPTRTHQRTEAGSRWSVVARSIALGAMGLIAGLSHEQAAVAAAWVVFVFFATAAWSHELKILPRQLYAAAFGLLVGTIAVVLSPGSMERLAQEPQWAVDQRFALFRGFIINTFDVSWRGAYPWLLLLLVLGFTAGASARGRNRMERLAWSLPGLTFISGALLVLLPLYRTAWSTSARATYISYGFLLVGVVCLLFDNPEPTVFTGLGGIRVTMIAALIGVALLFDAGMQYEASATLNKWLRWRNSTIYDAAANGGGDVAVPQIPLPNRRFQYIADFSDDPGHWSNREAANYFGVASITRE